jgi:hypothetical protein
MCGIGPLAVGENGFSKLHINVNLSVFFFLFRIITIDLTPATVHIPPLLSRSKYLLNEAGKSLIYGSASQYSFATDNDQEEHDVPSSPSCSSLSIPGLLGDHGIWPSVSQSSQSPSSSSAGTVAHYQPQHSRSNGKLFLTNVQGPATYPSVANYAVILRRVEEVEKFMGVSSPCQ